MIISHQCHFVVFFDPLSSHQWLQLALSPWADQHVSSTGRATQKTPFYIGMTPTEAKAEFARQGLDFDKYRRIAIVQNPYRRLAALYDRIRSSDPLWRLKSLTGVQTPDFRSWLVEGQYTSKGLLSRLLPGWRRQAAMSTEEWAAGLIDNFVRAEFAGVDLPAAMRQLDVVPVVNFAAYQPQHRFAEMLRYDRETMGVISGRFANDLRLYQGLRTRLDLVA
jgi:hypothetical protein